jgi:hypothetical protein
MNINTFHKTQLEIVSRFESGFSGYRGLAGPSCRKPSPIVEKLLKTLSEKKRTCTETTQSIHGQQQHQVRFLGFPQDSG